MSSRGLRIAAQLCAPALLASLAEAATLHVPEDYLSILSAVDAASAGDSVLVGPGIWTDRDVRQVQVGPNLLTIVACAFLKPGISVIATSGPEDTFVNGGPEKFTSQVTFLHNINGVNAVTVEGFTITGGSTALLVYSSAQITFKNCRIVDCPDAGATMRESNVVFDGCHIRNNGSVENLIGAMRAIDTNLQLLGCRIESNPAGGVWLNRADLVVVDGCEVLDQPNWRGMSLIDVQKLHIKNSVFLRNSVSMSGAGGALIVGNCQNGIIEFCTFAHDTAQGGYGGALFLSLSYVWVSNCSFYACHGHNEGSAVMAAGYTSFKNNIVANCSGGPALLGSGEVLSSCNLLWGNSEGDFAGVWQAADSDVFADPLFCDPEVGDWTLRKGSPALAEGSGGCGLIGALGQGCGAVSVESKSWGQIKGLYR